MYTYSIEKLELKFLKPAKTSRNVFTSRTVYFIDILDVNTGAKGRGEASPLSLLSIDDVEDYEAILKEKLDIFCEVGDLCLMELKNFPSIQFGIECALLDLKTNTPGLLYDTPFTRGESSIPINGLVWMNDAESMYQEALMKIDAGFKVIKFKVGALDFDEECRMLERIRKIHSAFRVTLRLDANGGFLAGEASGQLKELSRFDIHSIEQPIQTMLWDDMARLCSDSVLDIALDEELIGLFPSDDGDKMLKHINPQYLILKPNLIGGLQMADQWIDLAHKQNVGWWATSALESNVGLNAIAQWVSQYKTTMHQGLGTGSLFSNNTKSNLVLSSGYMSFRL